MSIRVYRSITDLPPAVATAWRYPAQADLFLSLDWFECLYHGALAGEVTPRIYVLSDAHQAVAALFCAVGPDPRHLQGLSNYYTMSFGLSPLAADVDLPGAALALARHIGDERPRWHSIDLRLLPADAIEHMNLAGAFHACGLSSKVYDQYDNWYLPTQGQGFDDYYAARSSRLRNTIARKEKKLRKAHQVTIRIFSEDNDALTTAVDDYVAIYNSSWKRPEPYPEFIPTLCRTCTRLGLLRLGVLYVDDQAAAAQLWITTPHKALIYKLAYREEFANLSVGSILSRELFRQALDDDRVSEIDYGVGNEAYKRDWMSEVRKLQGLQARNPRTVKGAATLAADAAKALLKRAKRA